MLDTTTIDAINVEENNSDINSYANVTLLHKRHTTEEWISLGENALLFGEFGINTTTGEVRGYSKRDSSDKQYCAWAEATSIGSIAVDVVEQTPPTTSQLQYVYGIEAIIENSNIRGYNVLTTQLPEIKLQEKYINNRIKKILIT